MVEIAREERTTPWTAVRILSGKFWEGSERELGLRAWKVRPAVAVVRQRVVVTFRIDSGRGNENEASDGLGRK